MKPETGYFSSFDQTKLFYRLWLKDVPTTILIIHGFGEHSGRYSGFVRVLDELPVSVIVHDLRGHGESEGPRVYTDHFDDFVKDVYRFKSFFEKTKKRSEGHRFILLGQSLGGLIASAAALQDQGAWQNLILLSPFFGVPHFEAVLKRLTAFLNPLAGHLIWANPIPPIFLTHDNEVLRHYRTDSLIQRRITIHLAHEMFCAIDQVVNRACEMTLPVFLLAAGDDQIVSLEKTRTFFERVSSQEKTMREFDGFYHELIHEIDREKIFRELKEYLRKLL